MDRGKVEGLFRRYSASVYRRARAILGDGDAAKDATQEVFVRAVHLHAQFTTADSPIAWLYRVTTNLCLTRLRDIARRRAILEKSPPPPSITEPSIDETLTVRALLRDLPEELQEIAVYYFVDHMSQDEIAEIVGLPRRTVSFRLEQFRTRARGNAARDGLAS